MTIHARRVLEDVRAAAKELREAHSVRGAESKPTIWLRFVTTIALLRAVGHVLHSVDGNTSEALRKVIERRWEQPKPPIFEDFIDGYRNAVLKRYEEPVLTFEGDTGALYPLLELEYPPGKNSAADADFLVEKAIAFWEEYLDEIDELVRREETKKEEREQDES